MAELSVERGLVRAFYPAHISCLATADPTTDPEWGLVCNGCGTILGTPGDGQVVATPEEAHDAEALCGQREIEPEPPEVGGAGVPSEPVQAPEQPLDVDDWAAEAAEQQMIAEQEAAEQEPDDPIERARGGSEDDPPWDEPETRMIAHEPVINDMPPEESEAPPDPHGSVEKSAVIPQDPIMAALDVIDPTRPYTPAEVEAQLVDLEARLERGQHFQRVWEERAYRTKLAFTMAYEAALVRIYEDQKPPMDVRQAMARTECKTMYEDMTLAEMMVKAVRESMHNLRSQLSGYQSIARSVGASMTGLSYRT